jgi:hypothetical protein
VNPFERIEDFDRTLTNGTPAVFDRWVVALSREAVVALRFDVDQAAKVSTADVLFAPSTSQLAAYLRGLLEAGARDERTVDRAALVAELEAAGANAGPATFCGLQIDGPLLLDVLDLLDCPAFSVGAVDVRAPDGSRGPAVRLVAASAVVVVGAAPLAP